ncbi:serine/threonine-protein phosphatase [Alkaliphilus pronyensis]|uniref:Serine/threonine-protein phosphatase n=1 Tax=Alkaliphilus pronyensis TaxID=1482732 RepID=A0A6I0FDB7_9FIRM|nr:protein phosphatase 2C domain-containing protein [Alkaliphilus pronyensis]KAB3537237.1 serine/threonine-protein phosphatase [Alkaliphilus pronyensis]
MKKRKLLVAACCEKGYVKEKNQDKILIKIGEDNSGDLGFFLVADGIGGLKKGELASQIAVDFFKEWWDKHLIQLLKVYSSDVVGEELLRMFNIVNNYIISYSQKNNIRMGTTLTTLFLYKDDFLITHIGDSRVYLLNNGKLHKMTKDHTLLHNNTLRELNINEGKINQRRNVLTQCIGVYRNIEPYQKKCKLTSSGMLLVCSDGLYKMLSEKEIEYIFSKNIDDIEIIMSKLKAEVLLKGAKDNLSAIIISF